MQYIILLDVKFTIFSISALTVLVWSTYGQIAHLFIPGRFRFSHVCSCGILDLINLFLRLAGLL